ncbi:MAG: peptide chain release factor N(5)-glutamine methyltransferase [Acutalibacteraceae bacterium]
MKKLYAVYREAVKTLSDAGCDSPEFDAQQLVEYCLNMNKTQLLMNSGSEVESEKSALFESCVNRRASREPLQYIIGKWDFHKFTFKVGNGVLIPRPETELLVEFAQDKIKKVPVTTVLDLCCGSGCVGITVAKLFPDVKVYCVDISDTAIEYTNENKKLLGAENVTVVKADVLEPTGFLGLPRPDIILSNPPYIKTSEMSDLQKEVTFEPTLALDGGEDGLVFYRSLCENWFPFINKGGALAMECGENQARDILSMFLNKAQTGRIIKDMQGIERVVTVNR